MLFWKTNEVLLHLYLCSKLKYICVSLCSWETSLKHDNRRLKCSQILWYYESKHLKFLGSGFPFKHLCINFTRTDSTRVLAIQFPCLAQYYKTFPLTSCKCAASEERLSFWQLEVRYIRDFLPMPRNFFIPLWLIL